MQRQKRLLTDFLRDDIQDQKIKDITVAEMVMLRVKELLPRASEILRQCDESFKLNTKELPLKEKILSDPNFISLLFSANNHALNKGNNYVVSHNLINVLSTVKINLTKNHLPEHFIGYFHLNNKVKDDDGDAVLGAFVYLDTDIETGDTLGIFITYVTAEGYLGMVRLKLGSENNLESALREASRSNINYYDSDVDRSMSANVYRLILNLLIYADNHQVFTFEPPTKKKPDKKYKYTKCTYQMLEAIHLKIDRNAEIAVNGHFRWQRHGPENSKVKLIYIKEYIKNKKLHNDNVISIDS